MADVVQQLSELRRAIAMWRESDPAGIGKIYERFFSPVREVVRLRMGPQIRATADSMDVVQDVFVRLLATVPPAELESESDVLKYLSAAVENRLRDLNRFHKRGKRAHAREESLPDDVSDLDVRALAPTPSQITMGREKYERYLEVVQALPDRQREAVILARHLLYPAATCARLLGMNSPAAFRTLLARALARTTLRMNES